MAQASVETLLEMVKRLPPGERDEFAARFGQWQIDSASDDDLIEFARRSLSAAEDARLLKLVSKSERGSLSSQERDQYVQLAREAERLDVRRAQSLAELVRRWKLPAEAVMKKIGWDRRRHGA